MSNLHRSSKSSRLLALREIDEVDDLDMSWSESFNQFKSLAGNKSEPEVTSLLQQKNLDRPETAKQFGTALLYGILTEENYNTYLRYLNHIVRDGFVFCVTQLKHLINDKYSKLFDSCRKNLLWLILEFIKLNVRDTDILCRDLLRQIPSGDISPPSIWLAEQILTLLTENKAWLYMSSELIPHAVYTFTRIISDHSHPQLNALKEKEVRFCVEVIREKFNECRVIGRDFVRLLQDLAKIPQFSDLWKDILQRPQSLSSQFTDLSQLFAIRTPRKFLVSRVTPDMEKLLLFIMQKVTMGNQKRYQLWFAQSYLALPENESLIVDLIRFICCVYHPSNAILSSDIVPRWAVIGWLLNSVKSSTVQANSKLALFYDWFYFNPQVDNIMNIEPGMLLMIHSIPKYAPFTAQLLEFILFVMEMYYPSACDLIRKGIRNSLQIMLSKGVVPSLEPLVACPTLDPQVRQKVINCFAPFLPNRQEETNQAPKQLSDAGGKIRAEANGTAIPMEIDQNHDEAMDISEPPAKELQNINDTPFAEHATKLKSLVQETATSTNLFPIWKVLVQSFCDSAKDLQDKELHNLTQITASFLLSEIEEAFCSFGAKQYLSRVSNLRSKTQSENVPLIDELHNQLFAAAEDDKQNLPISDLLLQLRSIEPRVGYHFLIFISGQIQRLQKQLLNTDKLSHRNKLKKLKKIGERKEQVNDLQALLNSIPVFDCPMEIPSSCHYNSYLSYINKKKQSFWLDCKLCAETDPDSFFWMLPQLCKYISYTHSADFVHIVVSHIDPLQLSVLLGGLTRGNYKLLGTSIYSILSSSLQWGSYEQSLLWQIVKAECSPEKLKTVIPQLLRDIQSPENHGEALAGIIIVLQPPVNIFLIDTIVTLPEPFKLLPTDLLLCWFDVDPRGTIAGLAKLCDTLCESDSRDLERAKNFLLHLTVWIFRSSPAIVKKIPPSFIQKQLTNLITEFDDDNTYANLLMIIGLFFFDVSLPNDSNPQTIANKQKS